MGKSLTYEQVKQFIEIDSNSGCKLLSDTYINCNEDLNIECACGNKFTTKYTKFVSQNKRQCNECGNKNTSNKQRKTQEQFVKEVYDLVGDEYTVLGEYINSNTNVLIRHEICGNEYGVTPGNFLTHSKRCSKCNGGVSYSHEEYSKLLYDKYGDEYKLLSEYIRSLERVLVKHSACGFEYPVFPYAILKGTSCPWCSGLYQDTNRFKQWVFENCGDEYKVLGEYKKASLKIEMLHVKCGKRFKMSPNNFKNGNRCPKCNESKGESKINKYFDNINNIVNMPQYRIKECRDKKPLPFDNAIFYNNELLFLIEFQGRQHFEKVKYRENSPYSNLEYIQYHDKIKKDYCKIKNIPLLEITYKDINRIPQILEEYLKQFNLNQYDNYKQCASL